MAKAEKQEMKIPYEKMVEMVTENFIVGSDRAFLKRVEKVAKGGGMFNDTGDVLHNKNKTFSLFVLKPFFFFMKGKDVILTDDVNNIVYEMIPKTDWPKFYEEIVKAIEEERNK